MFKFGNHPPRDLESFGVVGLLGEKCRIFYDSIFTSRHIGRVTDLLTAKLKGLSPDEMRLRIVMMFTLYETYRCQLAAAERGDGEPLSQPLMIECGVDSEKIAIGVAFTYSKSEPIDARNLEQTISGGRAVNRFERFIAQMFADSDQVVVRVQPETRRVEVVSIMGLPDKMDAAMLKERRPIEVIELKADAKVSKLKADYVELGDLDYGTLLKEDGPSATKDKPSTGEMLAISMGKAEVEKLTKIKGEKAEKEGVLKVAGGTDHIDKGEDLKLKKGEAAEAPEDYGTGSGSEGASEVSKDLETALKQVELYRGTIAQLQSKIEELETKSQKQGFSSGNSGSGSDGASESHEPGALKKLMKNIWPFNRQNTAEEQPEPQAPPVSDNASDSKIETEAMDAATGKMLKDQVETLQKTIEKIKQESQKLKNEGGNSRAQKWADGMVGELLAEKSRISEMAKKLNISFRQKELEFKNKERIFQDEIRKRDDQLKQRNYALDRSKEQLAQLTASGDRGKGGGAEENTFRQKLAFTQKLLIGAKEENMANARKMVELKEQLVLAQNASKTRVRTDIDLETLKTKYERVSRQADEFKRANQQLMDKLNELKPKQPGMSSEELKKKLESAMRLAATHQKDAEVLRMKLEEMQKIETRLKSELNRVTVALKTVKAASTKGSSEAA
jgi:hypothetical protein